MTVITDTGLVWPAALDRDAVVGWISRTLDRPVERLALIDTKLWGCTALAVLDGSPVVLKAALPAIFPAAHHANALAHELDPLRVPALLDWCAIGDQHWSLFEHVPGPDATGGGAATLLEIARVAAGLQRTAFGRALPSGLPVTSPSDVADLLADGVDDLDPALLARLDELRPTLHRWAVELEAAVPLSIDHPDLRSGNAIRSERGVVLIDWEEATVGCPLFSLDRLLDDARDLGIERITADAYAAVLLPGLGVPERRRLLGLSAVLAPIQRAAEARAFAAGLGWGSRHTRLVESYLRRSLAAAHALGAGGPAEPARRQVTSPTVELTLHAEGGCGSACEQTLSTVPTWFGIPEANAAYAEAADQHPTVVASITGQPVGLLTIVRHADEAAEVHLMAVDREHHRIGIGRALLQMAERHLAEDGVRFLQVKTLSARSPDDGYRATRAFYRASGFVDLEELPTLWDEANPALVLVKALAGAEVPPERNPCRQPR